MKKIFVILLGLFLVFGLVACSNSDSPSESKPIQSSPTSDSESENDTQTSNDDSENQSEDQTDIEGGKTLVVYFSASGNTKEVANYIIAATNADEFELKPVNEYTNADLNYNDSGSRVVREHDNPNEQDIELAASSVENWNEYDTVFIGYPIWWHIAAWPVNGFVKSNDFTGKTVIPFCTSASSDLGDSGKLLEEMAGTGNWLEGERFRSSASESDVQSWVNNLGL